MVFKGGAKISFETLIEVVWINTKKQQLGARFLNLRDSEILLLSHSVERIINQDLMIEEDLISLQESLGKLSNLPSLKKQSEKTVRPQKIAAATFVYLLMGGVLVAVTASALWHSLTTMKVSSSVVMQTVKPIITNRSGTIGKIYVKEGDVVKKDQMLLEIYDQDLVQSAIREEINDLNSIIRNKTNNLDDLRREMTIAKVAEREEISDWNSLVRSKIDNIEQIQEKIILATYNLKEAQTELQNALLQKRQEQKDLSSSSQISFQNVEAILVEIKALETQVQIERAAYERSKFLFQEGAISQERVEQALEKITITQSNLEVAQKRLANAQAINDQLQKGSVYNFNRFNGNLPRLAIAIQINKKKIQNIQNQLADYRRLQAQLRQEIKVLNEQNQPKKLQALQQDYTSLSTEVKSLDQRKKRILSGTNPIDQNKQFLVTYPSPLSGKVLKIVQPEKNKVRGGDTLMILEPRFSRPKIEAYLTKDQAALITKGMTIQVEMKLNGEKQFYPATITHIDYRGGFWDDLKGRYQFEGSSTQPVYLEATLEETLPTQLLMPGMPVTLQLPKKLNLWDNLPERFPLPWARG
ncbi:MAG: biotin/lipoyl-binding protein [Snowella sp.]|nr:biotin/lipoyl-binding protein [Snowella sp.]